MPTHISRKTSEMWGTRQNMDGRYSVTQTRRSLADFVEAIESSGHPEEELIRRTVERVAASDPNTAEALRSCAIPRRIDPSIIGALRGRPNETAENQRIQAALVEHSFVLPHIDGGYVYHDNVRDLLLDDWRRPENRERFDEYNRRLVSFWEEEQSAAQRLDIALARVAAVIEAASLARYRQVAARLEQRIMIPMLEALYHQTLISAQSGYDLFATYFHKWERTGRTRVCAALIEAEAEFIRRLYPQDDYASLNSWLQYFDARVRLNEGHHAEMEPVLRDLLSEPHNQAGDDKFRSWVLSDLGRCQHNLSKLREALTTYKEIVDLAERTGVDAWNTPSWQSAIADIYLSFDENRQSEQYCRAAIQKAEEVANDAKLVRSLTTLSGLLQSQGRLDEAVAYLSRALHICHTVLNDEGESYQDVALRMASLAARRSPELMETLMAEIRALLPPGAESYQELRFEINYIDLLQNGFQSRRAAAALAALKNAPDAHTASAGPELLSQLASIQGQTGQPRAAVATYTELLEQPESPLTIWQRAAALHNRGDAYTDLAAWDQALDDLLQSRKLWQDMEHRNLLAFSVVAEATVARRRGRVAEAARLLDGPGRQLIDSGSSYTYAYHRECARTARDQGAYSAALAAYSQSLQLSLAAADWGNAAVLLGEMSAAAGSTGDWKEAARTAALATELYKKLDHLAQFEVLARQRAADQENGRGMKLLLAGVGDGADDRKQASAFFRNAANLSPSNFWYRVNAAYAAAGSFEWADAADHMETAIQLAPDWWNVQPLRERVDEYLAKHIEAIESAAEVDPASSKAKAEYARALAFTPRLTQGGLIPTRLHAKLALIAVLAGEPAQAAQHWQDAVRAAPQNETAADTIAAAWTQILRGNQDYWQAYDALGLLAGPAAASSRQILRGYLDQQFLADDSVQTADGSPHIDRRILLTLGMGLVPADPSPGQWALFTRYIPEMRSRLLAATGVRPPAILVNGEGEGGSFAIFHDPFLPSDQQGTVPLESKYIAAPVAALAAAGVAAEALQPEADPLTGAPGAWVGRSQWAQAEAAGIAPLEDPLVYIVRHFEAVLLRHLHCYITVDYAMGVLEDWGKEPPLKPLVESLKKAGGALHCARLLRALVREHLPITNGRAILERLAQEPELTPAALPGILADLRLAAMPQKGLP